MTNNASLIDTGFWYASIDSTDRFHATISQLKISKRIIAPIPVVTEVAYLIQKRVGINGLAAFSKSLSTTNISLEAPLSSDYSRAAEILRKYNDNNIDFVDACIVAMAERLNITKILTVDHRHFRMFKPEHCESFELIPQTL